MSPAQAGLSFFRSRVLLQPTIATAHRPRPSNCVTEKLPQRDSMKITTFTTTAAVACACFVIAMASPASRAGGGRDITSVNGSVDTTAGETYDTLSTVNGDVHLKGGASAEVA